MTGPSFTSSTAIRAPKTPVSTWTPSSRSAAQKRSYSGSATSGRAAPEKRRAVALRGVRDQRELADDERRAAGVEQRAVELAGVVLEDPQPRDLARETLGLLRRVPVRDAEQDEEAGADLPARASPATR